MTDKQRPGRHSFDSEPRWPVADRDPQWPVAPEPGAPAQPPAAPRQPQRRAAARQTPGQTPPRRRAAQPPVDPAARQPREPRQPRQPRQPGQQTGRHQWPGAESEAVPQAPRRRSPQRVGRPTQAAAPTAAAPVDPDLTEMLPPIDERAYEVSPREPELLTHRYHDHGVEQGHDPGAEQRINALIADGDGVDPLDEDEELTPEELKKRRWKRIRRVGYACAGAFIVLPILAFAVAYFIVDIPSPQDVAAAQAKTVNYYFSDGKTVMGRDSQDGNRVILKPEDIPETVKHAVYAAEDASFETNSGFDISGILRAVKNQLTGGSGGGSTITQQYIKQATGDDERTIVRKGLEIVKAFKMNNELSKSEIITAYLNTIYFGRGAYGIQAASEAYFNKDAKDLKPTQAAYLAGIIQAPGRGDNLEYAQGRWDYVMGQMVENKWLTAEERAEAKFPKPVSQKRTTRGFTGPRFFIKQQITDEIQRETGFDENTIRLNGYKIYTTIDRRAQALAEEAVRDVMEGEPGQLREALVAVEPKTGGIKAYYGGPNNNQDQRNWANVARNPGSAIKPFDFIALLKKGKGPFSTYDGSSPRTFPGDSSPVHNSEGTQCPNPCSVMKAMEMSINTVFYDIVANDVKPAAVIEVLKEAGVSPRSSFEDTFNNIAIGGGNNVMTPRDMAAAYSTIAANGMRHKSHFVSKITTPDGEVVYQAKTRGKPAFDDDLEKTKQIAGNVTKTLEPVLPYSNRPCNAGRPCAGKTGTHQYEPPEGEPDTGDNSEAWMAGYTPQLSTAVWIGTGFHKPIKNMDGGKIYGSGLPGAIWKQFMDAWHEGKDFAEFPEVKLIGEAAPPPPPPPEDDSGDDKPEDKPDDKPDKPGRPTKPTDTTEPTEPTTTEPTGSPCPPVCPPPEDEEPEQ